MSPNLSVLPTPEKEACRQDALKLLEELREQVERGDVVSIAAVTISPDQYTQSVWSQIENTGLVIGAVSLLHARLVRSLIQHD